MDIVRSSLFKYFLSAAGSLSVFDGILISIENRQKTPDPLVTEHAAFDEKIVLSLVL